jgi:RIO-like serine/threonine protein kinase
VLERVEGRPCAGQLSSAEASEFFRRLRRLVAEVHARGVVHWDLRKLDNVLVDNQGAPVLVDFTASFVTGSDPVSALVFPLLVEDDIRGMIKLKQAAAKDLYRLVKKNKSLGRVIINQVLPDIVDKPFQGKMKRGFLAGHGKAWAGNHLSGGAGRLTE